MMPKWLRLKCLWRSLRDIGRPRPTLPAPLEQNQPLVTSIPADVYTTDRRRPQPQPQAPSSIAPTPADADVPRRADPVADVRSTGDPHLTDVPTGNAGPMCFRIANIPLDWSENKLRTTLKTIDPLFDDQNSQLSLYPACLDPTKSQIALLNMSTSTEYFRRLKSDDFNYEKASDGTLLVIDSHFYDLTPLNSPEGGIAADVVAVTGLAGHAFWSWKSRETRFMWLQDFLPKDFKNVRIMAYGYNSSIIGPERSETRMIDYRRNFIEQLETSRKLAKDRPIVFLGHCLGGILILQILIESKQNPHYQSILNSTHGIFFFGTPHQGLRTDELEGVVDVDSTQRHNLIMQLKEGSEFLETQKEHLLPIFKTLQGLKVVSFYETVKTASVGMLVSGGIGRDDPVIEMVQRFSAELFWPFEYRIPINKNHTDMVKFPSAVDSTYQMVVKHMNECIGALCIEKLLRFAIDNVNLEHFLQMLSAVDQEKHKSSIPFSECDQPKFHWIFRNLDFAHWRSADSEVLWLSGPPKCSIEEASSHIVNLSKHNTSKTEHSVLYFFCSSVATSSQEQSFAVVFIRALLLQIVSSLPNLEKKKAIIVIFLCCLVDAINSKELALDKEPYQFQQKDSPHQALSKVLNVSGGQHWDALKAVLDYQKQGLSIVIDGLDKIEHQKSNFLNEVCGFIEYLQGRSRYSKVKILLTSRRQSKINILLDKLECTCIEYDKERKDCLNSLRFDNTRYGKISQEHKGSCEWLWAHEEYQKWSKSDNSCLLTIEGKPGSGKSTLTKYLKNNLLKREPHRSSAIIASFFYSYIEGGLQRNHHNMLRSILHDILDQNETFFFHFQREYRTLLAPAGGELHEWDYQSLKNVLLSLGDHPRPEPLYLLIDAVDESDESDRYDILQLLFKLCSTKSCIVKVFAASRPVGELQTSSHRVIKMQDVNKSDICSFVHSFLPAIDLPEHIRARAAKYIVHNADGVFLWVHLVAVELRNYAIRGGRSGEIFDFLRGLPQKLEGLYERILEDLERNAEPDILDGIKIFRFVLFAHRPFTVSELQHALAIPDALYTDFTSTIECFQNNEVFGMKKRIIYCGGNLLEFKDDSTVQVMHRTVSEFFLRSEGPLAKSRFRMSKDDAYTTIVTTCIRYLIFCAAHTALSQENELPHIEFWASKHFEDYVRYLDQRPLINYALSHLKDHIGSDSQAANISDLVSLLVNGISSTTAYYLFDSWVTSHLNQTLPGDDQEQSKIAKKFRNTLLHTATMLGRSRVVDMLLTAGAEVDARLHHKTPLIISAEKGYETTALVLLDRGANRQAEDSDGRTALHLAAVGKGMERRLRHEGATSWEGDGDQRHERLNLTARNGHEAILRILLNRMAIIEAKDNDKRTALHLAAEGGHYNMAKLLLGNGADPECRDSDERTALHLAAEAGHEATVRVLLENGAKIDSTDINNQTALHLAAEDGYEMVASLLLEIGADSKHQDFDGRTALHLAAEGGHEATVRLLLRKGVFIDVKDKNGQTALQVAACQRYQAIAQLINTDS